MSVTLLRMTRKRTIVHRTRLVAEVSAASRTLGLARLGRSRSRGSGGGRRNVRRDDLGGGRGDGRGSSLGGGRSGGGGGSGFGCAGRGGGRRGIGGLARSVLTRRVRFTFDWGEENTYESRSWDLIRFDAIRIRLIDVDETVIDSVELSGGDTSGLGASTVGDLDLDARRILKQRIRSYIKIQSINSRIEHPQQRSERRARISDRA